MSGVAVHDRRAFPHRRGGHCASSALRDVLEHRGLSYGDAPLTEGAVFGLGGGLGFFYAALPGMRPPLYLVGRGLDLERDVAANLGAGLDLRQTDDPVAGLAWIRDEISAGRPAVVFTDIAHLDYLRVRMTNTRHVVVVVDVDEDEGVAWIADNDRDELQRCSLESLAAARSSNGFPEPNRHGTFVYDWPARLRDPRAAVADALGQAVSHMTAPGPSLGGVEGSFGLAGVDLLAEQYAGWPERFGDDLPGALDGLRVFIVKAGTGGALFRSLHATFLHDMADVLGDDALRSAARTYDALAERWRALAETAAAHDHAPGVATLREIARLERDGVDAMRAGLRPGNA
jgi:hypothetical protein